MEFVLNLLLSIFIGWLAMALAERVGIDTIIAAIIGVLVGILVYVQHFV